MKPITTIEQFNELTAASKPVIVKFYAGWCPDCTRMDMFIDPIIEEYNQYDWYELNRDELPELAEKYDVMGIPSLLIFNEGEKLAHLHSANAKSPAQVTEFLNDQMKHV
ncbi:thioredoxin family protein [Viridibacillus sp. YIM B01967]|uniref:Thioredoxin family protein n=1 Tax=Viridibacillus soli TaxID=2798301 RepID=A0ABS1H9P1_9BACL|nr:thioredoxin family protein [Viridibacillus soli]MBK3496134.1 thioredoxin family protein [Viridibacillus soli]